MKEGERKRAFRGERRFRKRRNIPKRSNITKKKQGRNRGKIAINKKKWGRMIKSEKIRRARTQKIGKNNKYNNE